MQSELNAEDPHLAALCRKIERDRGFFCSSYKDTCLRRRISIRMRLRGASSFAEYGSILNDDAREYDRLIASLTINVSKFFRNPETYACIATRVLPELAASGLPRITIWSAGCASGEEAYSLAVLCHQQAEQSRSAKLRPVFEIAGTDIDLDAVAAARRGHYPEQAFVDTTPAVRDRYFPLTGGLHAASPALRQLVSFHRHDLLDESKKPARANVIVCRNVIIYFKRQAQERLMERFHEVLQPGGFLVLGKVESLLGKTREMFAPVSARQRIYRRL
jgi:chemotaxis protein methyltransferase CheR